MESFCENQKKSKNSCFLAIFGLILAMFLTFQSYDFDAFVHAGVTLYTPKGDCVKFRENRMDSFWGIWDFHEKVGRKKTTRLHK